MCVPRSGWGGELVCVLISVPALRALREHEEAVGGVVVVGVEWPVGLLWLGLGCGHAVGHLLRLRRGCLLLLSLLQAAVGLFTLGSRAQRRAMKVDSTRRRATAGKLGK